MNEQQPNRKWDEIARQFPGRSRRAVECHGMKLLRDIRRHQRLHKTTEMAESRQEPSHPVIVSADKRRGKIPWTMEEVQISPYC